MCTINKSAHTKKKSGNLLNDPRKLQSSRITQLIEKGRKISLLAVGRILDERKPGTKEQTSRIIYIDLCLNFNIDVHFTSHLLSHVIAVI